MPFHTLDDNVKKSGSLKVVINAKESHITYVRKKVEDDLKKRKTQKKDQVKKVTKANAPAQVLPFPDVDPKPKPKPKKVLAKSNKTVKRGAPLFILPHTQLGKKPLTTERFPLLVHLHHSPATTEPLFSSCHTLSWA